MKPRFTVGLDVGTQGAKAVVFDLKSKKVVSRASRSYGLLPTTVQGRAEQDPATWISEGFAAIREAVSKLDESGSGSSSDIVAVGVSGQQHGSVFLDSRGKVLRPAKLWCDTETAPQAERLSIAFGEPVVPAFTAPKVAWLLENEPRVADDVACVCLPHDYVNMRLTGDERPVSEAGDASGTGYWDVENRSYDPRKAAAVDERMAFRSSTEPRKPSWLPELVDSPDVAVGTVCAEASKMTSLPEGIPVSAGSGDNACAALGVGAVTPGDWVVSLGTSGTLFGPSSTPPPRSPSSTVARFCDATGQWMPLLCTLNCTVPVEQVRRAWGLSHERAAELASRVARGRGGVGGLTFLPYLAGERTPNWPWARGCVLGLEASTLDSPESAAGSLYLAAIEGATFSLLAGLREMGDGGAREPPPRSVILVGGGARSDLWARVVADSFGLPVTRPSEPEAAALGAALQAAAVAEGSDVGGYVSSTADDVRRGAAASAGSAAPVVEPDLSKRDAYEEAFERHVALGEALFGGEGGVARKMFLG